MSEDTKFDVTGPLPSGVAVLEASAGTGKTFTIAALATRYVAAGRPLEDLLIVTFTRMATGELRERVRERLVSAERILDDYLRLGAEPPQHDEIALLLIVGKPEEEIARSRDRLARAVADFDAATITTTHGFCLEALGSLGFTGDVAADCTFVEDVSDLIDEVVDDLYVRRFHWDPLRALGPDEARRITEAAIKNPADALEPQNAKPDTYAAMRLRLANAARDELERRKRLGQVMTYDDLLTRLDATLKDPSSGPTVAARLRERYKIVLVDEFQDTDPVQWSIMQKAFDHPGGTLVLIGDPKQAIYAFRGADVYAYLKAARTAGRRQTLATNYRSDQGLITAYDQLFAGAQLGHEQIVYRDVQATHANQASRLIGAPNGTPLRMRVVDRLSPTIRLTPKKFANVGSARDHVARDVAAEIVALLDSGAEIEERDTRGEVVGRRPVRPGDLAVLVRRNKYAAEIRARLDASDVPAVVAGAGSVFDSDAARDWLRLLEALERPTSTPRARAAALTVFLGWPAERIAGATEEDWETVHRRLHHWAYVLRTRGVASLVETISLRERLPARMLSIAEGERGLTDLRHVGQLLHGAATDEHLGAAALTAWLRKRIAEAARDADEERSRRLESDAAAVQVLTIHRSKGLEFPIVFYPDLWEPSYIAREAEPVFFHDPRHDDRRTIDVGLEGSSFAHHQNLHRQEVRGEDLRLAYVALTRAQHQSVVWWAGSWASQDSPLTRLLFSRSPGGEIAPAGQGVPEDAEVLAKLQDVAAGCPDCLSVETSAPAVPSRWGSPAEETLALRAATFDRTIDRTWRRTSYSDMTAGASHGPRVGSEPEETLLDDEPVLEAEQEVLGGSVPLADMPGGVHVGTLVHDLLEVTDFAAASLEDEVRVRLEEAQARRPVDVGPQEVAVAGLCAALRTPLGPLVGDRSLSSFAQVDRLDELGFELPLVGGESPTGALLTPGAIASVLSEQLDADDPLHAYAARLADPDLRGALRGYLTGSIDLVFRADGKYGIVDYKTNRLGDFTRPLVLADHEPGLVREEMYRSHYALQGLLYTVALHRYLRWRLPSYAPETDLAGVFYCFLRGMTGPDTPRGSDGTPYGVFAWRPPGALVVALSDLLDVGVPA